MECQEHVVVFEVCSFYLYDDNCTPIINISKKLLKMNNISLNEIEMKFSRDTYTFDKFMYQNIRSI